MEMHCKHAWYPLGLLCNCFRYLYGICRTFAQNSLCRMEFCCHRLLFVGLCHHCRAGPRVLIAFELFGIKRLYPPHGFLGYAPWVKHGPSALCDLTLFIKILITLFWVSGFTGLHSYSLPFRGFRCPELLGQGVATDISAKGFVGNWDD